MNTKKFLGLALASTLALTMTAPAFAAPGDDEGGGGGTPVIPDSEPGKLNFSYTGETWTEADVIIDVSMPTATSGNIILNPYKLDYVKDSSTVGHDPIVTGKYNYVENNSTFPVDVAWEITGTTTGDAVLVEKNPTTTATAKEVYLPIKLNSVKAKSGTGSVPTTNIDTKLKAVKSDPQVSTDKTVVILDASNATASTALNKKDDGTAEVHQFLCFGIEPYTESGSPKAYTSGANLNTGKNLAADWTAEDSVSVSMIFTFSKHK